MTADILTGLQEALATANAFRASTFSSDWSLIKSIEDAIAYYSSPKVNPYAQPPSPPPPPQQITVNATIGRGTLLKPQPY
jgi:hypothetical protein